MERTVFAAAAGLVLFATAGMGQGEQPSQTTVQGTALLTNFGIRAEYRGLVYKTPDFTLTKLNPDKVTHLAQPSVGFYFPF